MIGMFQFLKNSKSFVKNMGWAEMGLLQISLCALAMLAGAAAPRKKKAQTGLLAGGVFVATCLPLMNRFLDAIEVQVEDEK